MKLLTILLFILISTSINAQVIDVTQIDPKTGLDKEFEGKETGYTKEWGFSYVKLGEGILSSGDNKYSTRSFGIGHRQYAEEFVYGLELNSLQNNSKVDQQSILASLGLHKQWKHRLKPYALVQFGSSKIKFKDEIKEKASGYYTGLDVGLTLSHFTPFHFLGGMRWGSHNFSDEKIKSASSQELYVLIGFEF
jgi:hypothetical protein